MSKTEGLLACVSRAQEHLRQAALELDKVFGCVRPGSPGSPGDEACTELSITVTRQLQHTRVDLDKFHRERAQNIEEEDLKYVIHDQKTGA